jgi:hypothetical protein
MTAERYVAYCETLRSLDMLPLARGEREVLRDAAEGFLLARSEDSGELGELGLGVSIVLDRAVSAKRLTQVRADDVRDGIDSCGPAPDPLVLA